MTRFLYVPSPSKRHSLANHIHVQMLYRRASRYAQETRIDSRICMHLSQFSQLCDARQRAETCRQCTPTCTCICTRTQKLVTLKMPTS